MGWMDGMDGMDGWMWICDSFNCFYDFYLYLACINLIDFGFN